SAGPAAGARIRPKIEETRIVVFLASWGIRLPAKAIIQTQFTVELPGIAGKNRHRVLARVVGPLAYQSHTAAGHRPQQEACDRVAATRDTRQASLRRIEIKRP